MKIKNNYAKQDSLVIEIVDTDKNGVCINAYTTIGNNKLPISSLFRDNFWVSKKGRFTIECSESFKIKRKVGII